MEKLSINKLGKKLLLPVLTGLVMHGAVAGTNLDKKTPVGCLSVFFSNYCLEKVSFHGDQTPLSMSKVYWPIPESREPLMEALSKR